jgi:hypothetical protein
MRSIFWDVRSWTDSVKGPMRKYRTIPKDRNESLAKDFSNLLKLDEDCKTGKSAWPSLITVN